MVYAGRIHDRELTLGVSGRLLDGNLLMWDPESNSLWSQIGGEAVHGPRLGQRLEQVSAVFVGFDTWVALHPGTLVLDLSAISNRSWHYTTANLARGENERGEPLGIALREGGEALLVPLSLLNREKAVQAEVGGLPVLVVWIPGSDCALAYDRRVGGRVLDLVWRDGRLVDRPTGAVFDPLRGTAEGGARPPLVRLPYIPTTVPAWTGYHPGSQVLGGG